MSEHPKNTYAIGEVLLAMGVSPHARRKWTKESLIEQLRARSEVPEHLLEACASELMIDREHLCDTLQKANELVDHLTEIFGIMAEGGSDEEREQITLKPEGIRWRCDEEDDEADLNPGDVRVHANGIDLATFHSPNNTKH